MSAQPVLWHLTASHYNEKARWALDFKRVPHERRAVTAGFQDRTAKRLTGGKTTPILVLDGEAIGDSTRIIEALERRHPEPPLYPEDPEERRRALALEDFFDEEFGPYCRRLLFGHMLPDAELFTGALMSEVGPVRRRLFRALFGRIRPRLQAQFSIDDAGIAQAWAKVRETGERFRAEVGPSGYLVGDRFTVADLTLAALLAPPVAPEQFPYPQPQRGHPLVEPLREALAEHGLVDWCREMYARHRGVSAEV